MGEHAGHPGRARELVVLMDRIEIAGSARVPRELDLLDRALDERWKLVADLDVVEIDFPVFHSLGEGGSAPSRLPPWTGHRRIIVTWRMVATISFARSAIAVSRITNAIGPLRTVFW